MKNLDPKKLKTAAGVDIPAFFCGKNVKNTTHSYNSHLDLKPSSQIMAFKALSVGHALEDGELNMIPVANLSAITVWLTEGVSLRTIDIHNEDTVPCNIASLESGTI